MTTTSLPSDPSLPTEWDTPLFAFHDLDYIPSGFGGVLAPYIETGPGTMRAAARLMGLLDDEQRRGEGEVKGGNIICDLGCGDGEFLIGLLAYVNRTTPPTKTSLTTSPPSPNLALATGIGIDHDASLLATATCNAIAAHQTAHWLHYDFNVDAEDLGMQLRTMGTTHLFVYLIPQQLALGSVRGILEGLVEGGVVVCCHKFQPTYLRLSREDVVMDLCVYERG